MIKSKNGTIKIEGSTTNILADFSIVTRHVVEYFVENGMEREKAVELINEAFRLGLMTDEEVNAEMKRLLMKILMEDNEDGEADDIDEAD